MEGMEMVQEDRARTRVRTIAAVIVAAMVVVGGAFAIWRMVTPSETDAYSNGRVVMRKDTAAAGWILRTKDAILAAQISEMHDNLTNGEYVSSNDMEKLVNTRNSSLRYRLMFESGRLAELMEANATLWRDTQAESKFEEINEIYKKIEAFKKASSNKIVFRDARVMTDSASEPSSETYRMAFYDYSANKDVEIQYKDGEFYLDGAKIDDRGYLNPDDNVLPIDEPTPVTPPAVSTADLVDDPPAEHWDGPTD